MHGGYLAGIETDFRNRVRHVLKQIEMYVKFQILIVCGTTKLDMSRVLGYKLYLL
jgi:hypothetical protein